MLKELNPLEKFIFSIGTIIVLISTQNLIFNIGISIVLGIILMLMDIKGKRILFFFLPPFIFLIPTLLAQGIKFYPILSFTFEWEIFFRVISSLMAIAIFVLTIKFKDFYHIGVQLKIPKFICEIAVLMFNYLNIMFLSYVKIKTAMEARGAFTRFKNIYRDTAMLFSKVFLNSYFSLKGQANAMYSRGYNDEMKFYPIKYKLSERGATILTIWFIFILVAYKVVV